jgi:hypothetical protein
MAYNSKIRKQFVIRIPNQEDQDDILRKINLFIRDSEVTILACLRAIGWSVRPQLDNVYIVESSSIEPKFESHAKILWFLKNFIDSEDGQDPYFDIPNSGLGNHDFTRITISKNGIKTSNFENFSVLTDDTEELKKAAYYFVKSLVDRGLSKDDIEALLKQAMVEAIFEL